MIRSFSDGLKLALLNLLILSLYEITLHYNKEKYIILKIM